MGLCSWSQHSPSIYSKQRDDMQRWLRQRHKVNANPTIHHSLLGHLGVVRMDPKVAHPGTYYYDAVSSALEVPVHKMLVEDVERGVDGLEEVAVAGV